MRLNQTLSIIALAALLAFEASGAKADTFDVSLNTSSLSGTTQTLAFSLSNNDGAADNTVSLSSFNLGGGSAVSGSEDCTLGGVLSGVGCGGNLTSGVSLTDTADEVFFSEQFNVGSSLSFALTTSNNFAGGIPDGFFMYLCSADLSTCYSDDPTFLEMLQIGIDGTPLAPNSFITFGATAQGLPAPVVTTSSTTTAPEPSTLALLGFAILGLVILRPRLRPKNLSSHFARS